MNVLLAHWETQNLIIQDSVLDEVGQLRDVFNSCSYAGKWDKTFIVESEDAFVQLVSKSLNRGESSHELFQMQSVRLKGRPEIVGYFHLYYGVPKSDIVVMSMFEIHPDYQKRHFGAEIVTELAAQLKQFGDYASIWGQVYLKNWPALRFWMRVGFTTIIEYRGDKIHAEDTHASLILEKRL